MRFQIESNIRAHVLINLLNSLRKRDRMLGKPRIYLFPQTRFIYPVKHEHSCKILFLNNFKHYVISTSFTYAGKTGFIGKTSWKLKMSEEHVNIQYNKGENDILHFILI